MLQEYLQPDSTKEVSNRDVIQINALANKYLDEHDKTEHPISLLASLEYKITPSEDVTEMNANIAAMDTSEEKHMNQGQISLEEDPILTQGTNEFLSHKDHINSITNDFNGLDPFHYDMFNPKINFVSDLKNNEESIIESGDSIFDDAMSNFDEGRIV